MDVASLNTSLLDIREGLIKSPFLQTLEKHNDVLNLDKDKVENKVYSKSSFKQKYYGVKTFGLKSSKEIVSNSINAGFTPLDAIQMNKALQSFSMESFMSKNGVELLSQHFHVI